MFYGLRAPLARLKKEHQRIVRINRNPFVWHWAKVLVMGVGRIRVIVARTGAVESNLEISAAKRVGVVACDPDDNQRIAIRVRRQARVHEAPTLFRRGPGLVNAKEIYERTIFGGRGVDERTDINVVTQQGADHLDQGRSFRQAGDTDDNGLRHAATV